MSAVLSKTAVITALAGNACAWVVHLAGVGSLQERCQEDIGTIPTAMPCSRVYRYDWFILSAQFALMAAVGASMLRYGVERLATASYASFYTVLTVLYIIGADRLLGMASVDWFEEGEQMDRLRTAAAGAIMTATLDCVVLLALTLTSPAGTGASVA